MFQDRVKLGKGTKGYILKLGMNSIYGKMVQTVGKASYANPVYGSMITSITRGMILEMIAANPRQIVSIATDGVYSMGELVMPEGHVLAGEGEKILGAWEVTKYDELFLVQPGVYYYTENGVEAAKSRGFLMRELLESKDEVLRVFKDPWQEKIELPPRQVFYGVRRAMHENAYEEKAGQWKDERRVLSFMAIMRKRKWNGRKTLTTHAGSGGYWELRDKGGSDLGIKGAVPFAELTSLPYQKRIGGIYPAEYTDMVLEDPDGPVTVWD